MKIRTLSRCPGTPGEWQWTEAHDADAPDGATVEDYVEAKHDGCADTHVGVYLVSALDPREAASIGVEDIRGRIHRQIGQLVAWVPLDGPVTYELVTEGD